MSLSTVNNITILSVAQKSFNSEFMSQASTINGTQVFMQSIQCFSPIVTKFGVPRKIFIKLFNLKFRGNQSGGKSADI